MISTASFKKVASSSLKRIAVDGRRPGGSGDSGRPGGFGDNEDDNPRSSHRQGAMVTREINPSFEYDKPPILFIEHDISSSERSIYDLSSKRFHAIKNPNFCDAAYLRGKGQWLLMERVGTTRSLLSLFLLNPVSGVKIDLPTVHGYTVGPCAFSMSCDSPELIISASTDLLRQLFILRIIRTGDEAWKEYSMEGIQVTRITKVHLVGSHVLCVGQGGVIIFDLLERYFTHSPNPKLITDGLWFDIECNGEVLMVDCPLPFFNFFRFRRFDWGIMKWVTLDESELENASWYLGKYSSCMRRGRGMKAYTLQPDSIEQSNPPNTKRCILIISKPVGRDPAYNIYLHDLARGPAVTRTDFLEKKTTESLMPDDVLAKNVYWVDADILDPNILTC